MNYKSILYFLGVYSLFISLFSILNIFYSIYFDFILGINSYLVTLAISLSVGLLFCYLGYHHSKNIYPIDQIVLIVLSFLYIPILVSIPYFLSIYDIGLLDAYFESVSGITTTGFSIIQNFKNIDEPLLLWRSSSQWLGGLLFLIAIIGTLGSKQIRIKPAYLVSTEASGRNFYNNFNYNFFKILTIYFMSTLLIIFLLTLTNIRLLDSLHLAFTTISSGGFIPEKNLSNIVRNDLQIFILSITLLFPLINFYLFFKIFTRQFKFNEQQEDLHLIIIIVLLTLIFYFFIIPNETISSVFLSVVSSITTSGISTYSSNFDVSLFFILLTIIGGSVISTSSGLKYVRFYILLKVSFNEIYKLVKPINISNLNLFQPETKIDDEDSKIAFLVFISFIIAVFFLSSILTLDDISFENSFKLSILTLTNTVNSQIYSLNDLSFFDLNTTTKISLITFMILAKIEIITFLFLIRKFIFKV